MNRTSIMPPPPPPAGVDPRQLRPWFERTWLSLRSCADAIRNIQAQERTAITPRDVVGGTSEVPWYSLLRHGFTISGTTITLLSGKLKFHGGSSITTPQASFTLGGTQYFYVHHVRGSTSCAWQSAGTEPGISSSDLDVFFYKFVNRALQTDGVGHLGDINFDLPMG